MYNIFMRTQKGFSSLLVLLIIVIVVSVGIIVFTLINPATIKPSTIEDNTRVGVIGKVSVPEIELTEVFFIGKDGYKALLFRDSIEKGVGSYDHLRISPQEQYLLEHIGITPTYLVAIRNNTDLVLLNKKTGEIIEAKIPPLEDPPYSEYLIDSVLTEGEVITVFGRYINSDTLLGFVFDPTSITFNETSINRKTILPRQFIESSPAGDVYGLNPKLYRANDYKTVENLLDNLNDFIVIEKRTVTSPTFNDFDMIWFYTDKRVTSFRVKNGFENYVARGTIELISDKQLNTLLESEGASRYSFGVTNSFKRGSYTFIGETDYELLDNTKVKIKVYETPLPESPLLDTPEATKEVLIMREFYVLYDISTGEVSYYKE